MEDKCDKCVNWPLGCELDGTFRRLCKDHGHQYYEPIEGKKDGFKQ